MNLASPHCAPADCAMADAAAHHRAKPLRIAVLLGDAANLTAQSAIKLGQCANVRLFPSNAALGSAAPASLTALLGQAVTAIEQGKLVELRFNECVQTQSNTQAQPLSLWLLDDVRAAKLRLHAHAFIASFAAGNEALSVAKTAFTAAKRSQACALQHQVAADSVNEALIALRRSVMALAARTRPPLNGDNRTTPPSGYWFSGQHQARVLCLNLVAKSQRTPAVNQGEICQSVILTQGTQLVPAKALLDTHRLLVPISGDTLEMLSAKLRHLLSALAAHQLDSGAANTPFATELLTCWFEHYDARAPLALVLMATSIDELQRETQAMLTALAHQAVHHGQPVKTPAGSCFYAHPLGDAGLTFVYPGVGTVYPNMFNNLHEYFPTLYQQLAREGDLSAMLQSTLIYADETKTAAGMSLSQQAISGVGASYLFTKLLTQVFHIQPKMALGYSMGEAAMWASLDVWQTPHAMISATENSDIFNHAISGELTAVRQAWQLDSHDPIVWNSFVVRAKRDDINALLPEFPRVYLAIIQGDSCVIAGCETSCQALLAKLGKRGIAANRVTAMHTTPAMLVHGQVQDFYTQALNADAKLSPIRFISAAQTAPVSIDSHSIGRAIADTFCAPLDFSGLIQRAYEQGANLFVEVGADRQTSTLIDKICQAHLTQASSGKRTQLPHCASTPPCAAKTVAMACNTKGADALTSLLKCLAQLICHRVPLSLAPLMPHLGAGAPHLSSAVLLKGEPQ
ncbi:MAG: PfaB family protein [Shewanella sp.]|uniref:PfaB family protein n=1 Tax=Shewanella sp. TaxID=50422 RepID=UPI003F358B5D